MCCTNRFSSGLDPSTRMLRKGQIPDGHKPVELHWGQLSCVTGHQLRAQAVDLAAFQTMATFHIQLHPVPTELCRNWSSFTHTSRLLRCC